MPIGGYRFRRSFGNVRSRFRGALQKNFPFYVISGRVLDLFRKFTSSDTTIPDISGEGNEATLYTGRPLSTDGVLDRGIVADCSAAGAGTYYLTGKVRPTAVTVARMTIDGSTSSTVTGLTADVWQTFQTATSGSITPSSVVVGWDGTTASAGDWSDVRLINAATGAEVAHWQLNESADSDLDGYLALDSSGDGYHGTHTGCAGGTGEGIDTNVVGAAFAANEDKMYFDGVDDEVVTNITQDMGVDFSVEVTFLYTNDGNERWILSNRNPADPTDYLSLQTTSGGIRLAAAGLSGFQASFISDTLLTEGQIYTATIDWDATATTATLTVEGIAPVTTPSAGAISGTTSWYFGSDRNVIRFWRGLISSATLSGVTWDGTIANLPAGWTTAGSPVTVGQKRATILQTAGMDWNKRMWFDGVDDGVTLPNATNLTSADFTINISFLASDLLINRTIISQEDGAGTGRSWLDIDTSGNLRNGFGGSVLTLKSGLVDMTVYSLSLSNVGGTLSGTINGGAFENEALTTRAVVDEGATGPFRIGQNKVGGALFHGIAYDVNISGVGAYAGDEIGIWTDTTGGGNDGTVNGSPGLYLIPESDTTASEDALGNAIALARANGKVFNGFGEGEKWVVSDAVTLDAVKTIEAFVYYNGTDTTWFDLTGLGSVEIKSVSGVLTTTGITSPTLYVNGLVGSSLNVGWNYIALTTDTAINCGDIEGINIHGSFKAYSTALTYNEIILNYNAQCLTFGLSKAVPDPFTMTVDTTNAGSASDTFILPAENTGTYNAEVDWGDGSTSTITAFNDADLSHTYTTGGVYTVKINGKFPHIKFNNVGDKLKLLSIEQWGTIGLESCNAAFYGCANMVHNATDTFVLPANCAFIFESCTSLNQSVANFDTSNVTNMNSMFAACPAFNQSVANFDTSLVTVMTAMFQDCPAFNQSLANFDTSLVIGMSFMFQGCTAFNQSVANFDTSNVTNMQQMFDNCPAFNQSVSNFDTSNVANMRFMFNNCTAFKQSLATFDITALNAAGNLNSICNGCDLDATGTANYDATLIAWDAQRPSIRTDLTPNFGASTYSAGTAATARAALITYGWTITDGGQEP